MDTASEAGRPQAVASLPALCWAFFKLGATTFGGMWAATSHLEAELADRRGWVHRDELPFLLVAATLIPAPKFMALGGLIGYKLRGVAGSALAALSLVLPGAVMVVAAVALVRSDLLAGVMDSVQRAVGVGVAGITFGSALRQLRKAKQTGRNRQFGLLLAGTVAVAIAAGVPLLVAAAAGFAIGAAVMKGE